MPIQSIGIWNRKVLQQSIYKKNILTFWSSRLSIIALTHAKFHEQWLFGATC